MAVTVQQIFAEKFRQIQSRLPVKMNPPKDMNFSFEEILDKTIKNSNSSETNPTNVSPGKYSSQIENAINAASAKYGVDPNLIRSIIKAESGFNPNAVSKAGAQGLMQLMPGTARGLGVTNSFDINQNVNGGTKYFKDKLDQFGGDIRLALAAYNAGPNAVKKYNGIPPYTETKNYVKNVLNYYDNYNGK